MTDPTYNKARYAKGMIAVHCPPDGSGYKTRAARIASGLPGRYSNRERAYIMTPANAARMKRMYDAGSDADLGVKRDGTLGYVA